MNRKRWPERLGWFGPSSKQATTSRRRQGKVMTRSNERAQSIKFSSTSSSQSSASELWWRTERKNSDGIGSRQALTDRSRNPSGTQSIGPYRRPQSTVLVGATSVAAGNCYRLPTYLQLLHGTHIRNNGDTWSCFVFHSASVRVDNNWRTEVRSLRQSSSLLY